MKKNYRFIPQFLRTKIETIEQDEIVVSVIKKMTQQQIENHHLISKIISFDPEINILEFYLPPSNAGSFSKKNIIGYKIKYRDRPKVRKTFYYGERPIFGDYSRGTFSLYVTREVIAFDEIPPRDIYIQSSLLEEITENNIKYYTIKFQATPVINKNDDEELFFNINILQENIGAVNVFPSNTTLQEYLNSLHLNWEIFPPGTLDENLRNAVSGIRHLTIERTTLIRNSLEFLQSLNPEEIIIGTSGMNRYIGGKYSENLVVFENSTYGNALYILFEDWQELSQLSRLEIQSRPPNQFIRIRHTLNWQEKARDIINAKRT